MNRYEASLSPGSSVAQGPGAVASTHNYYGADGPPYVFQRHRDEPASLAELRAMRGQPSKLLLARRQAIAFTGRADLLRRLRAWLDGDGRAAWLFHAPGGQGKTRLASHLATLAEQDGWTAVWARHRTEGRPAEVSPVPAGPLLVIADYADRWPAGDLQALLSSVSGARRVRLVLLARSAAFWPQANSHCDDLDITTRSEALPSLTGTEAGRREMSDAACARFAGIYEAPEQISPVPGPLSDPDYALTLALHMAALAAVDATVHNEHSPASAAGLSEYLLKREAKHWHRLYGAGGVDDARRTVFTAALLGPVGNASGLVALTTLGLPAGHNRTAQELLDAHARCYPAAGHSQVLEPLYPDRLAEDFIALTLPGDTGSPFADPWSAEAVRTVSTGGIPAPVWTPRPLLFLAAAARRWPHVRTGYLEPMLRDDPALALDAGSAGLAALAEDEDFDLAVLAAIEDEFPEAHESYSSIEVGMAALNGRLFEHQISTASDPVRRADLLFHRGLRLYAAGRPAEALTHLRESLTIFRELAAARPDVYRPAVAVLLNNLAGSLTELGRYEEAVEALQEGVSIRQVLAQSGDDEHLAHLARMLGNLGRNLAGLERDAEAHAALREAVAIMLPLFRDDPDTYHTELSALLNNLANILERLGRLDEALKVAQSAVRITRSAAGRDPERYQLLLAATLTTLGTRLADTGRSAEARTTLEEAAAIGRVLAAANPSRHQAGLLQSLTALARVLCDDPASHEAALPVVTEAIAVCEPLAARSPAPYTAFLTGLSKTRRDLIEAYGPGTESAGRD
ncbi:tetratricopeptide repeat protein [Longispora albida]|uniref:tetratricopeptide repeat protein n=1 Tax=Longispora albida TaxID=203523 RepID=UPI0003A2DFBE|nr:tetratricopeptide repeat protein [Longispora albida]